MDRNKNKSDLMKYRLFFLFLITCLFTASSLFSQNIPRRPSPPRLVNDFANLLQPNEQAALERKLVAYEDSTSTQIAIVIMPEIGGADAFDYSFRLAQEWGIGQEDNDNGILMFVAVQERKFGFQTGYGAEGFLPDAMGKRIIQNIIVPAFRQGNYYQGFDRATDTIFELASGEYTNDRNRTRDAKGGIPAVMIILFLLILIVVLSNMTRGHDDDDDGGYYRGGRYDMDDYPGRRRRRRRGGGGWIFLPGGGFGGGGSGDGGGFGGFGGFGGGDFGGGGAFGDW